MNTPPPFEVTPEALNVVASLLQQHRELSAGLIWVPSFDQFDEVGKVEAHFEHDHFMIAHDSPEFFSRWPTVELCGQSVPVAPDALERLKGKTLSIRELDVNYVAGGKETRGFLVAA